MKKSLFILLLLLGFYIKIEAQILIGVGARYDDSFREWTIATDLDGFEAAFFQRWQMQNDWTEWDVTWGNNDGTIRQKWRDDPTQWELRLNKQIISINTRWGKDINEWLISDGKNEVILETRYTNDPNLWLVKKSKVGTFRIKMFYENDARDWEIEDRLEDNISDEMRLALVFVAIFHSSQRK